jgi:hypothetical protein
MIPLSNNNPKGIIWIASYPRSGNTWTRAFLNSLFRVMHDPASEEVDINRIEEGSLVENAAALYPRFLGKPVSMATPAEIAAARPRVQAALVESAGRPIYLKTHNANGLDHGSPLINMGVSLGAIYLVRNPLDVAISYAHLSNAPIDRIIDRMATSGWGIESSREKGLEKVRVVMGSWSENVGSWTARPHPAVLVVRYEDMVGKPNATFARMAQHLRVKPSTEQLRRAIAMADFNRLRAQEEAAGFNEKPDKSVSPFFREGRVGQWREVLSPEQVSRVVAAHRPLMKRFDYLPRHSDLSGAQTAGRTRA